MKWYRKAAAKGHKAALKKLQEIIITPELEAQIKLLEQAEQKQQSQQQISSTNKSMLKHVNASQSPSPHLTHSSLNEEKSQLVKNPYTQKEILLDNLSKLSQQSWQDKTDNKSNNKLNQSAIDTKFDELFNALMILQTQQQKTSSVIKLEEERLDDLTALKDSPSAKSFYEQFRAKLFGPLNAYLVLATNLVSLPSSALRKKIDLALGFIPMGEILSSVIANGLDTIENEIQAANAAKHASGTAKESVELVIATDYVARKLALAYNNLLKQLTIEQAKQMAYHGIETLLEYLWTYQPLDEDIYINQNEDILPEAVRQKQLLTQATQALLIGKPNEPSAFKISDEALKLLERLENILGYTEPVQLILNCVRQYNKPKDIKVGDKVSLPLTLSFKLAIELKNQDVLCPPHYSQAQYAALVKGLQEFKCATRKAIFDCDTKENLSQHGWTIQAIKSSSEQASANNPLSHSLSSLDTELSQEVILAKLAEMEKKIQAQDEELKASKDKLNTQMGEIERLKILAEVPPDDNQNVGGGQMQLRAQARVQQRTSIFQNVSSPDEVEKNIAQHHQRISTLEVKVALSEEQKRQNEEEKRYAVSRRAFQERQQHNVNGNNKVDNMQNKVGKEDGSCLVM